MTKSAEALGTRRQVTIPCHMCHNGCGITVHVEDGKVATVEGWRDHPFSRGKVCVKSRQIPDYAHNDARIKYPMRRDEHGGWQRISWDEALDTIAEKLEESKRKYGAASVGVMCGDPVEQAGPLGSQLAWRFCDVFGTPTTFHSADLCGIPFVLAQLATAGSPYEADTENSKCIIVWADNPEATYHVVYANILQAKKRGAKLIVIDPRRISLVKKADMHLKPRPGTDGIILLAMIHTIISEGLYDREFVEKWTLGFDKLAEHVKQYTPEEAERVSGVASEDIKNVARMYALAKPASIWFGFKLHHCQCGFQNHRSIEILAAITGNLQETGGHVKWFGLPLKSSRVPELTKDLKPLPVTQYPIFQALPIGYDNCMVNWGDLVLNDPPVLRSMIVQGANPAVTWPNSSKVREALSKLEFLVVMDIRMTATAKLAHIVLPAASFLEKLVPVWWRGWFLSRPVIDPQWESRPDSWFWVSLAKKMGYEQYFPWQSDEEIIDHVYEPAGLSVKKILETYREGYIHHQAMPGARQYEQEGFSTLSGKVELYSQLLEKIGVDPLPTYSEPRESPLSTPELFEKFPLILTTGTKEIEYYHSQHRYLDGLRRRNPEPVAQIHPDTAAKYGITHGEVMVVETRTGRLPIKANVTDVIMPGVVSVPHAWEDAPANMLTDDTPADSVTGYAAFTGLLCRVRINSNNQGKSKTGAAPSNCE